jgi:hypothetical protein
VNPNLLLHNRKFRQQLSWLAGCLFLLNSSLQAQYDTVSPEVYDTVRTEVPTDDTKTIIDVAPAETVDEEETRSSFLPLSMADTLRLQRRSVPDSILNQMQEDDAFWYANASFEKKKPKKETGNLNYVSFTQRKWFKTLLWILIAVAFIAVIIFYLADSNFGLFRRKKKTPADTTGDPTEMPEDIFAINYQLEIDRAAAAGNYRLAVRLQYLRLLKSMAERDLIRYQQDKTNMDYLMQLFNTAYYHDFFRITRHYEYSWYGHFEVSADAYRLITRDIHQFENRS